MLLGGSLSGAAADTPATRAAAAQQRLLAAAAAFTQDDCTDTRGLAPYATGLPPLPCSPNPFGGNTLFIDGGATFNPIDQIATKAKLSLQLAPSVFRVFYIICNSTAPPNFPPCPFPVTFPAPDPTVTNGGYYGVFADAWPQSAEGTDPQFGLFPPTEVNMLGFGALPVHATVTIKQKLGPDGLPLPFKLRWLTSAQTIKAGAKVPGYEEYPPAPGGQFFAPPTEVGGSVDVVLSNVTVDKVPLDVGSNCHTSTTLSLGVLGGYYKTDAPAARTPRQTQPTPDNPNLLEQTGAYQPLSGNNSYLSGKVDLPAFSGCTSGGQDLSPLVTGMVSSKNNPVFVTQVGPLRTFGCVAFPTDPLCATKHPATTYGP